MKPHLYRVGETVAAAQRVDQITPAGLYEVVRLLPSDAAGNQYRIRSVSSGQERVVGERELA